MDDFPRANHVGGDGVPDDTRPPRFDEEPSGSTTSSPPAGPTALSVSPPKAHAYEQVVLDVANASTDSAQYCVKLFLQERHDCAEVDCKVLSMVTVVGRVRFTIQVPNMGASPQECGLRVETMDEMPCSGASVPFQYMPALAPNIARVEPPSVEPGAWLSIQGSSLLLGDVVEFSGIPVEAFRDAAGVLVQHGVAVVAAAEVRYHSEQLIEAKVPEYESASTFGGYVSVARACPDATSLVSNYSYLKFRGAEAIPEAKDALQDRLARVEQRCAALTDKLEAATRNGAIAAEVGALRRSVDEIRALLGALPVPGRDDFTCACGAKGWIGVRVRCTCCGRDETVGFFPPPELREPPGAPQREYPYPGSRPYDLDRAEVGQDGVQPQPRLRLPEAPRSVLRQRHPRG